MSTNKFSFRRLNKILLLKLFFFLEILYCAEKKQEPPYSWRKFKDIENLDDFKIWLT